MPTLQRQKPNAEVKNLAPNHTVSSPGKVTSGSQLLSGSETSESKGLTAEPPALTAEHRSGPSQGVYCVVVVVSISIKIFAGQELLESQRLGLEGP